MTLFGLAMSSSVPQGTIVHRLCVPGMGSPRYKDSEFFKWCKSTVSELAELPG